MMDRDGKRRERRQTNGRTSVQQPKFEYVVEKLFYSGKELRDDFSISMEEQWEKIIESARIPHFRILFGRILVKFSSFFFCNNFLITRAPLYRVR